MRAKKKTIETKRILKYGELKGEEYFLSGIDSAELWLFFKEYIGIFMIWGRAFGFRVFADKRFITIADMQCAGLVGSPDEGYCCRGEQMPDPSFTIFRNVK
jgi:hypothetical protein